MINRFLKESLDSAMVRRNIQGTSLNSLHIHSPVLSGTMVLPHIVLIWYHEASNVEEIFDHAALNVHIELRVRMQTVGKRKMLFLKAKCYIYSLFK